MNMLGVSCLYRRKWGDFSATYCRVMVFDHAQIQSAQEKIFADKAYKAYYAVRCSSGSVIPQDTEQYGICN